MPPSFFYSVIGAMAVASDRRAAGGAIPRPSSSSNRQFDQRADPHFEQAIGLRKGRARARGRLHRAGSGMPQCAVMGWPGQIGQVSRAALSQTVITMSSAGAPGRGEFHPAFGAQFRGLVAEIDQEFDGVRIDAGRSDGCRPKRRGNAACRACWRSPRPGSSGPNFPCKETEYCGPAMHHRRTTRKRPYDYPISR